MSLKDVETGGSVTLPPTVGNCSSYQAEVTVVISLSVSRFSCHLMSYTNSLIFLLTFSDFQLCSSNLYQDSD